MSVDVRSTSAPVLWLAVGVNVPVGLIAYGWGFVSSYMLNDLPDSADLRWFLTAGLVAFVLSTVLVTSVMAAGPRKPLGSATRTAAGVGLLIHAVFLLIALPLLVG